MLSRVIKISLVISLLLHLLLLLGFSLVYVPVQEQDIPPGLDIPAYVYQQEIAPTLTTLPKTKHEETSQYGLSAPKPNASATPQNLSMLPAQTKSKASQPVHLIGDKNVDKPFITLLGKALAAHLIYPKIALDFKLRGTTLVGFTIFPDGRIEGVQLVKSSGASVLDQAALTAVTAMSPVQNVAKYLPQSRYLVVGIIFG